MAGRSWGHLNPDGLYVISMQWRDPDNRWLIARYWVSNIVEFDGIESVGNVKEFVENIDIKISRYISLLS